MKTALGNSHLFGTCPQRQIRAAVRLWGTGNQPENQPLTQTTQL